MRIYSSPLPPVHLPEVPIFDYVSCTEGSSLYAVAFIDGPTGEALTRRDVLRTARNFARGLMHLKDLSLLPMRRGNTVTILSPNSLAFPIATLGLIAAGVRVAFASSASEVKGLVHVLRLTGSSHVLVHPTLLSLTISAWRSLGLNDNDAKARTILLASSSMAPVVWEDSYIDIDQITSLAYVHASYEGQEFSASSASKLHTNLDSVGTTGLPKAINLCHSNVTSVLAQCSGAWTYYDPSQDHIIAVIPFFHIFGGILLLFHAFKTGVPVVVMPTFEPLSFLSAIGKYRITVACLVPPLLDLLALHPIVDRYDTSSLRIAIVGGANVRESSILMAMKRHMREGVSLQVLQAFGLTEMSGCVSFMPPGHILDKIGSVGLLLPNVQCRFVGTDGIDVPEGEPGELWLKGPNAMKGYLNNPEATEAAMASDGWFKTGDIAKQDRDGFLMLIDRKEDLVKYKSYQVPPSEIEALLASHPAVADACVIGTYCTEEKTELLRAYIAPRASLRSQATSVTEFVKAIQDWVTDRVDDYKRLRGGVVLVEAIPRSAAGKILRKDIHTAMRITV
ncbi:AMP binding protein [Heliocybe sulcata]|uniref:AMP binding protein n=1 Tax=Heliocybe sulcata TaxID=5364 RepID=A0A5C3N8S8_9AGAM|nr:AMP binding protein [Heliocybe sulcata]